MAKRRPQRAAERERRIIMEIVIDAFDSEERARSWYYYLESQLQFPFTAACIAKRAISPLRVKGKVEVIGVPGEDKPLHEMFVTIRWQDDDLAPPLAQRQPLPRIDAETRQAVEDWPDWVKMGYEL